MTAVDRVWLERDREACSRHRHSSITDHLPRPLGMLVSVCEHVCKGVCVLVYVSTYRLLVGKHSLSWRRIPKLWHQISRCHSASSPVPRAWWWA